jgi:hypothetical protein
VEIIAICYANYTYPINTLRGQNTEILLLEFVVHTASLAVSHVLNAQLHGSRGLCNDIMCNDFLSTVC